VYVCIQWISCHSTATTHYSTQTCQRRDTVNIQPVSLVQMWFSRPLEVGTTAVGCRCPSSVAVSTVISRTYWRPVDTARRRTSELTMSTGWSCHGWMVTARLPIILVFLSPCTPPLNLRSLIWLLMKDWSKRRNINIAALVIIVQYSTLVVLCSRQLIGPADWVFVTLGPLRCD